MHTTAKVTTINAGEQLLTIHATVFLLSITSRERCQFYTSCARGDTMCLLTLQVDNIFVFICPVAVLFRHNNIFVFIRQVAPVPTCWLFKTSATS